MADHADYAGKVLQQPEMHNPTVVVVTDRNDLDGQLYATFSHALANNESTVRKLGDDTLKKIAIEITEKLRKSTTVDWQVRDSVRARLKILVRRTLQRWKYPPDKAVELVLKQAETLSNAWTR